MNRPGGCWPPGLDQSPSSCRCRNTSGRRSSTTSSCSVESGRRRRGSGRRSTWRGGRGSAGRARETAPEAEETTTTTSPMAASPDPPVVAVPGEEEEEGAGGLTNPSGPAPCWPTTTWWSWSRSSRCRASSPRAAPARRSRPRATNPSSRVSWASSSSSPPRTRRRSPRPPQVPPWLRPRPRRPPVAALKSVPSRPARRSIPGNSLTSGRQKAGPVWTEAPPRRGRTAASRPGRTWTGFRRRSRLPGATGPKTATPLTQTLKPKTRVLDSIHVEAAGCCCEEREPRRVPPAVAAGVSVPLQRSPDKNAVKGMKEDKLSCGGGPLLFLFFCGLMDKKTVVMGRDISPAVMPPYAHELHTRMHALKKHTCTHTHTHTDHKHTNAHVCNTQRNAWAAFLIFLSLWSVESCTSWFSLGQKIVSIFVALPLEYDVCERKRRNHRLNQLTPSIASSN